MIADATLESSSQRKAYGALIAANVALAFGPMFVRMSDVGPVAAGFWRMTLAIPLLAYLALRDGGTLRLPRPIFMATAVGGLMFAADLASWHLGIVRTRLANATLFGNTASLLFPVYGFLVARAWPTRMQAVALALAMAGAVLLMGRSYEISPKYLAGDVLCVAAGVFYTGYFIAIARARDTLAPLPLLFASTIAGALPLLPLAALIGERAIPGNWTPLIALALGSQVLGQGLMVYVLGRLSPLIVGIGLMTQPVVAATIGWMIYDERLETLDFGGAALVGLALILVRQPARD